MPALSKARNTVAREVSQHDDPVKAGVKIHQGGLVCLDATGYAVPASTAVGLTPRGRAQETVDNTAGADGAVSVKVRPGTYRWDNDGTDTVNRTHIGGKAYAVDDQTVASTDGTGTRSEAGVIEDVDALGVWVTTGK